MSILDRVLVGVRPLCLIGNPKALVSLGLA
jgi:hypothetical protein